MEEKSSKAAEPCSCCGLHVFCDAQRCPQQQFAVKSPEEYGVTFNDLRVKAKTGCSTCAGIVDGLNLRPVKSAWIASIRPAVESGRADSELRKSFHELSGNVEDIAEKYIRITILPRSGTHDRVVIRTNASHNSLDWRHFNFNLSKRPSGKFCIPFPALTCFPVDQTESNGSYEHLTFWLDTCNKKHSCYSQTLAVLPKRVLRISGGRVFLYLSKPDERARYTTLSHRWGLAESFTLTRRNLDDLVRGVAWADLPKTGQDAVKITQRVGVTYLWIDALCIMQTDEEDWHDQSVKMCDIYGGSYLNIAANDSNNSSGGCFRKGNAAKRSPVLKVPGHVDLVVRQQPHFTHHDFGSNYRIHDGTAPLLKRSWVLQERLLSPRVVYYGKDELVWECKDASDCQCGGITTLTKFKQYFHDALRRGDPLPFAWMRISERYSSLHISYDSDRAIALSGIAKHAHESGRGGRYLAGLWMQDLAHQLCWEVIDTWRKPTEYLAPSWSWLSVFGSIAYSNRMDFGANSSLVDVLITEASCTGTHEDGTGTIQAGYIKLNGRMLDMQAELEGVVRGQRAEYRLSHQEKNLEYCGFQPDYTMNPKNAVDIEEITILYWGKMWPDQTTFLVLREHQKGDRVIYERLGLFWLPENERELAQRLISACERKLDIYVF